MITTTMRHIKLFSGRGLQLATVEVPAFDSGNPPAVTWARRFFVRIGTATEGDCYAEVFCYEATVEVRDLATMNGRVAEA